MNSKEQLLLSNYLKRSTGEYYKIMTSTNVTLNNKQYLYLRVRYTKLQSINAPWYKLLRWPIEQTEANLGVRSRMHTSESAHITGITFWSQQRTTLLLSGAKSRHWIRLFGYIQLEGPQHHPSTSWYQSTVSRSLYDHVIVIVGSAGIHGTTL